jgi:hypothetical protein
MPISFTRGLSCSLILIAAGAVHPVLGQSPTEKPAEKAPAAPKTIVAFPHPLVSEILFDVPRAASGDANKDGQRDATGDEFIEITNPHDKPISLKGYILQDADRSDKPPSRSRDGGRQGRDSGKDSGKAGSKDNPKPESDTDRPSEETRVRFVFPDVTLQPGQVAVVFNGLNSKIPGVTGLQTTAPTGPNAQFDNAMVFSMGNTSKYAGLSNSADSVNLIAPDGVVVECIVWGEGMKTTAGAKLVTTIGPGAGSLARQFADGAWSVGFTEHVSLAGPESEHLFSPGRAKAPAKSEPAKVEPAKSETPKK